MSYKQDRLSKIALPSLLLGLTATLAFAQRDPFSSLGTRAQAITGGSFVTGLIEFAIVVAGPILTFSRRAH
jgi:hypothetical protein